MKNGRTEITVKDNDNRNKAMSLLNSATADVEITSKRLHQAKSEVGTAMRDHAKALKAYDSARNRLVKLVPKTSVDSKDLRDAASRLAQIAEDLDLVEEAEAHDEAVEVEPAADG